jgi:hypothetical protein
LLEDLADRVAEAMWAPEYRPIRYEPRVPSSSEDPEEA